MKKYFFLLLVLYGGSYYLFSFPIQSISELIPEWIQVEVKGAVNNPGIFEVPYQSTYSQVLSYIKLWESADLSSINLQSVVYHKDVIVIPEQSIPKKVSINTASLEELMLLPGIGEATATNIILYRESNGSFQRLEDLMNVSGIGNQKFEKLKDLICL